LAGGSTTFRVAGTFVLRRPVLFDFDSTGIEMGFLLPINAFAMFRAVSSFDSAGIENARHRAAATCPLRCEGQGAFRARGGGEII
jgi:hypothetical protein